jgi:glycosyltransferase involved in cell wall biosynthesis
MRVLIVHNYYSSRVPSGENLAVSDEITWLREAGLDVHVHEASNDAGVAAQGAGKIRQVAEMPWSPTAGRRFAADLERLRPDVVHVHNLFPMLTASVPWAAVRADVPIVWTCHNRRLVCVEGTHYRDGAPCHLCRPGWRMPGVRHGCYQRLAVARGIVSPASSAVASGLVSISTSAFGRIARRRVTAVGIADNVGRWLVEDAGFAPERVRVKFNGIPGPDPARTVSAPADSDAFLFAGQLADYKGLPELLDAWRRRPSPVGRLRIVGDGMCAPAVEAAAARDPRITFVGPVPQPQMADEIAGARVIVAPSTTPETFGRVAAEALAYGRPVITSGLGGLGEIVDDDSGWVVGTDPAALARAIDVAAVDDEIVAAKGAAGRARHQALFSPQATTEALIDIYREVLDVTGRSGHRPG